MKLKRLYFVPVLAALIFMSKNASAQLNTGGNVSVSYDDGVYFDVAPIIGYKIEDLKLNLGLSPIFSYKKPLSSTQTILSGGGRIFGQFYFLENAFLHGEFQTLNTQTSSTNADGSKNINRVWTAGLPVGAGYEYRISDKARFQASVLYDILQDKSAPNRMPVVRGGIVYDL
ncbi:hypothetical protein [Sporocytophaga myxococcoides]|nr:hypothetical protein [Sporocytophaga myxococcoides]